MTERIEYFLQKMTQRIEHFFDNVTQRIEHFFENVTQRIELCWKYDSKNWTLLKTKLTELNYFWKNMTRRIEPFFSIWPNLSFQHALTLLFNMTHRNWNLLFNMTQRNWTHFLVWLKEYFYFTKYLTQRINWSFLKISKNWTFFWIRVKDLNSLPNLTQRIEPRLELLLNMTQRIELFFNMTHMTRGINFFNFIKELSPFFEKYHSSYWPFSKHDSQNWTIFSVTQRIF